MKPATKELQKEIHEAAVLFNVGKIADALNHIASALNHIAECIAEHTDREHPAPQTTDQPEEQKP